MKKIQKNKDGKIINPIPKNGKIKVGGKIGVDIEATPEFVTGRGGIGIFFQLPTLIAFNIFRKIGEHIKKDNNDH